MISTRARFACVAVAELMPQLNFDALCILTALPDNADMPQVASHTSIAWILFIMYDGEGLLEGIYGDEEHRAGQ